MKIINMLLGSESFCDEKELYYHAERLDKIVKTDEGLHIENGETISFDTYFNSLDYAPFFKHTNGEKFTIRLSLRGRFSIEIVNSDITIGREIKKLEDDSQFIIDNSVVSETVLSKTNHDSNISSEVFQFTFAFSTLKGNGIVFPRLTALADDSTILRGEYHIDSEACNKIKIGIVICTFKREDFVIRTLDSINKYLQANPYNKEKLSVFIIDNGNTLNAELMKGAKVFSNRNTGGSGGFTRGMLEVRKESTCSHFLLMDDDISFETEILSRTIAIIELARDTERLTVGASMLVYDTPHLQYEKGATWGGHSIIPNNRGYDLRLSQNIIRNTLYKKTDYTAWWYCCMPVSTVDRIGIPLPMFIKDDDIEYSLRAQNDIILINGVGVWHESFINKYSSELEYYVKRNEMIVNCLYKTECGAFFHYKKLMRAVGLQLVFHRYAVVDYLFLAYNDFLLGAEHFNSIDLEKKHLQLRSYMIKQFSGDTLRNEGYDLSKKPYKATKTRYSYIIQLLTLNGYLIPKCFYKKEDKQSYRIVDMNTLTPKDMYKSFITVQYNPKLDVGFVSRLDKKELVRAGFRLFTMFFKIIFKFNRVRKQFRDTYPKICKVDNDQI